MKAVPLTDNLTRSLRRSNSVSSTHNLSCLPKFTATTGAVTMTAPAATATIATTSSAATATHTTSFGMDRVEIILGEIGKLKSSIDSRFNTLSNQLQSLDVPNLVAGIDSTVIGNGSPSDQYQNSAMLEKISMLEKKNAELSSNLDNVSSSKPHCSSSDLVIGDLTVPA